jgi:hypothetical protein
VARAPDRCLSTNAHAVHGEYGRLNKRAICERANPCLTQADSLAWWAHFAFTRLNITRIILRKKIEDLRQLGAFMFPAEPRSANTREVSLALVELCAGLVNTSAFIAG